MITRRPFAAAAAAVLALCSGNALADASASSALSQFTITLIDLAPDDGITPWVTFDWAAPSAAYTYAFTLEPYGEHRDSLQGDSAFGALNSTSSPNPSATASASIAGDPFAGGMSLVTSAFGAPTYAYGVGRTTVGGPRYDGPSFTVSANTEIVLRGVVDESATVSRWAGETALPNCLAALSIGGQRTDGWIGSYAELRNQVVDEDVTRTAHGVLEVEFFNSMDVPTTGTLQAYVETQVFTTTLSVPEPASLALMFAGLVALGATGAARRRGASATKGYPG